MPLLSAPVVDAASSTVTTMIGTPGFIAPEVLAGGQADVRSDLYALGAVAYWLLTATTVFPPSENSADNLTRTVMPPSARLDHVLHVGLEELVLACLQHDPTKRPESAAVLRSAIMALCFEQSWNEDDARAWWSIHSPK